MAQATVDSHFQVPAIADAGFITDTAEEPSQLTENSRPGISMALPLEK
jgi:hypothetical protein